MFCLQAQCAASSSTFTADAACQLDVLGHDGDTLGMDGTQVGVLKQADQVGLCGLLQRQHGAGLEAQVCLGQSRGPGAGRAACG